MATDPNSIIGALLNLPNSIGGSYAAGQDQAQQRQAQQQQLAIGQMQLNAAQAQAAQDASYQSDVSSWLQNGAKPEELPTLAAKYPRQYQAIQSIWKAKDDAAKTADQTFFGSVYSAANNDRADLVKQQLQQRRDAEAKAGIDTSELDDAIGQLSTDPDGALKTVKGVALAHLYAGDQDGYAKAFGLGKDSGDKTHVITPGGALVDDTGKELYRAGDKPDFRTVKNADGSESIVQVGGGNVSPAAASGAPRSVRNNNPGNLRASTWTKDQPGYQGVDNAGYAMFDTPQNGQAAGAALLAGPGYYGGGKRSVASIIRKWAPPASAGGDNTNAQTANYIKYVSGQLGVAPGDELTPDQLPAAFAAMTRFEGGATGQAGATRTSSSVAPAQAAKILYTSKPAASEVDDETVNFYGQKVAAGGDLPSLGMGKDATLLRQAILHKAAQIQMGEGMTGGDSNLLHANVHTATLALGNLEKTLNSINPYIDNFHNATAQIRAVAPQGLAGSIPIFNRWIQAGRKSISGDPQVSKLNYWINAAANENAKIVSGATGGQVTTDSARKEAMELINNAQTPDQLYGVLDAMDKDSVGRRNGLASRAGVLRASISGHPGTGPVPSGQSALPQSSSGPSIPTGARQIGTYRGAPVYQLPDGRKWTP